MLDQTWLRQRLKEVGWSKKGLAKRLGVSYETLKPSRQQDNKTSRNSRVLEYAVKYLLL